MTVQRNEVRGPDSLRLEQLEQADPTLTPLLARATTEFARLPAGRRDRLPARPLNVTSDTWIAMVLCAGGWTLEEIEGYLAARKEMLPGVSLDARRWLAEAYDRPSLAGTAAQPLHVVYLAQSRDRLEVRAPGWREALELVGEPDACLVEKVGNRSYDVTLLIDGEPFTINTRARVGTEVEALRFALDNASNAVPRLLSGPGPVSPEE